MKQFMKEHHITILLFICTLAYFFYQHATHLSWDFIVYVLNAQYLVNQSTFFEILRPPLMSLLLIIFNITTWKIAEYVYIIFATALFFYAANTFSKTMNINRVIFLIACLTPYFFMYAMINGTEILTLALMLLFLSHLMKKSFYAGLFLGLATLARYNVIIFLPLLLFIKKGKDIITSIAIFILTWIPWLIYNYTTTGNMLTSLADNYLLNIKLRDYYFQATSLAHAELLLITTIPFILLGFVTLKKELRNKEHWIMILIAAIILFQYATTASKEARYLFIVIIPVAFYTAKGIQILPQKITKIMCIIFVVINILLLSMITLTPINKESFNEAITTLEGHHRTHCRLFSNAWPLLTYLHIPAEQFPRKEQVQKRLAQGDDILLFFNQREPEWMNDNKFINTLSTIQQTDTFMLLGTQQHCNEKQPQNKSYTQKLKEDIKEIYNYEINTNPCFTLFETYVLAERVCNFMNGNGWQQDKNRVQH